MEDKVFIDVLGPVWKISISPLHIVIVQPLAQEIYSRWLFEQEVPEPSI